MTEPGKHFYETLVVGEGSFVSAVRDLVIERKRQVNVEHYTPEHDDEHTDGSLAQGAEAYLVAYSGDPETEIWPWQADLFKPDGRKFSRRDLIKAGALIIAELERLDRAGIGKAPDAPIDHRGDET